MSGTFDTVAFRKALGQFATGVTVIATVEPDGTPRGFTANSFTSVSLDPPLVLVCVARRAASLPVFCEAPGFSVNVLAEPQQEISGLFATQRPDKFEVTPWRRGAAGMPLIDGALAWFECARHQVVDAGDHVVLIGRVTDFGAEEGRPLGFFRGGYLCIGLEGALVDAVARGTATIIGGVFERDGAILLEDEPGTGGLRLPAVGRSGSGASVAGLGRMLRERGLATSIEFVNAVFEDRRTGVMTIYYRGHASGDAPDGMAFVPFDAIPWPRIADSASRTMLERYVREAVDGGFAVYMGDETDGVIRRISQG